MGYRLEVRKIEHGSIRCGKLYAYTTDEELLKMKSYQWLSKNGFLKDLERERWFAWYNPQIILSSSEFVEFINLYKQDFENYWKQPFTYYEENLKELLESKCDVLLEWG